MFGSRKGQWFLVSGLILIFIISSVALSRTQIKFGAEAGYTAKEVYNNVKDEVASVVNIIITENATSENLEARLMEYGDFIKDYGVRHGIAFGGYAIVGLPSKDTINVTIVNFETKELSNVRIVIGGEQRDIDKVVANRTVSFPTQAEYFPVNYTLTIGNVTDTQQFETARRTWAIFKIRAQSEREMWQNILIY